MKSMCCPTGGSWSDVSCATSCTSAREINDIQEAAGRASGSLRLAWVVLIFALLIVGCGKTTPPAAKPKASGNKIAEQLAAAAAGFNDEGERFDGASSSCLSR